MSLMNRIALGLVCVLFAFLLLPGASVVVRLLSAALAYAAVLAILRYCLRWLLARHFILLWIAAVAYLVAWNLGIRALYAFSAFFLGLHLLSWCLPRLMLHPVQVHRQHRKQVYEGERLPVVLQVHNPEARALRMLEITETAPAVLTREPMVVLLARLAPGESRTLSYSLSCERRGKFTLGPLRLGTGFPLGLVRREMVLKNTEAMLWVYPRWFKVGGFPLLGEMRQHWQGASSPHTGGHDDFSGVREYRRGDSPRHIHWKATARHKLLLVREYERHSTTLLTLVLDLSRSRNVGVGRETTLEYAIRIAASLASFALEHGHAVQLVAHSGKLQQLGPLHEPLQFESILRWLAELVAEGEVALEATLDAVSQFMPDGSGAVLFLPETLTPAVQSRIASLARRGIACAEILLDTASFLQPSADVVRPQRLRSGLRYLICQGDDLARQFPL